MLKRVCLLAVLSVGLFAPFLWADEDLPDIVPPEDFLGHQVGADFKLARWGRIVEYFEHIGETSDRVLVEEKGRTTEGKPYIMATISTPENLRKRFVYKRLQRQLSHPNEIKDGEKDAIVNKARNVILINCAIHSDEIASSQMAMELLYNLATQNDLHTQTILENCIILLVPSANPDGIDIVAGWYERSLDTPWEGSGRPWLYHKYTGHDNNRDWFMITQKETEILSNILYHEWYPSIVYDLHQMGNSGLRLFVPPFEDPVNPHIDPLIIESLKMIGGHMATELAAQGKTGVASYTIYDMWWHGGARSSPYRHNMIGILTEAASPRLASPIFQKKSDLRGHGGGVSDYQQQIHFANPWPGGWWRLRDVVDYELIAVDALLELAAKYREKINANYFKMGEKAIQAGQEEPPYAFVFPLDQHDLPTLYRLLNVLRKGGVEIHVADTSFEAEGARYPKGTPIVFCAQPYRSHILDLLLPQEYPDRPSYPGGPPEPPYDVAGWTLTYQMGVDAVPIQRPVAIPTSLMKSVNGPQGEIQTVQDGSVYLSSNTTTNDFILINRCFERNIPVSIIQNRASKNGVTYPKHGLIFRPDQTGQSPRFESWVKDLGLKLKQVPDPKLHNSLKMPIVYEQELSPPRIGLYQPWTRNMDEGWTRFVLEQFEFDYTTVHNDWIRAGRLNERLNVLIIPDMIPDSLLNGQEKGSTEPEYAGGIGKTGAAHLQKFVEQGGRLLFFDSSSEFAIDYFNLPIKNVLDDIKRDQFFCPGSVLRIALNPQHPLAAGMPRRSGAVFARSLAFEAENPSADANSFAPAIGKPTFAAIYDPTLTLLSGWIRGREHVQNQGAVASIPYGQGQVVLYGFRVQHRAQPHGTFRLLFNGILLGKE